MHAVRWSASPRQGELTNARSALVGVAETGGELTHMRSMCVGVAETGGIDTYAKHVCWLYLDFIL